MDKIFTTYCNFSLYFHFNILIASQSLPNWTTAKTQYEKKSFPFNVFPTHATVFVCWRNNINFKFNVDVFISWWWWCQLCGCVSGIYLASLSTRVFFCCCWWWRWRWWLNTIGGKRRVQNKNLSEKNTFILCMYKNGSCMKLAVHRKKKQKKISFCSVWHACTSLLYI